MPKKKLVEAKEVVLEGEELEFSDDLLPNEGGSSVFIPEAQEDFDKEVIEEKTMVQGAGPELIAHIIEILEAEIKQVDSIRHLDTESKIPVEAQILGMQYAEARLNYVKNYLVNLKQAHTE